MGSLTPDTFVRELSLMSALEVVDGVILPLMRIHGGTVADDITELANQTIVRAKMLRRIQPPSGYDSSAIVAAPVQPVDVSPKSSAEALRARDRQEAAVRGVRGMPEPPSPPAAAPPPPVPVTFAVPSQKPEIPRSIPSSSFVYKGQELRDVRAYADRSVVAGYVFHCTKASFPECISRMLLGAPQSHWNDVKKIKPNYTHIFLYDIQEKNLYGVFEAIESPAINIEPDAWATGLPWPRKSDSPSNYTTPYPVQVRVKVNIFFKEALTKSRLLPLVTILGDKKISRFRPELSPTETMNIIQEFIDVNR